jgi:hypothetical protein
MSAPALFKQADVKRAVVAVKAAGLSISRVEIDLVGRIVIHIDQQMHLGEDSGWDADVQTLHSRTLQANSKIGMAARG